MEFSLLWETLELEGGRAVQSFEPRCAASLRQRLQGCGPPSLILYQRPLVGARWIAD